MDQTPIDKAINCYEAGCVSRYHTHPRLSRFMQTDAAHSWGVAALITQLHPEPSRQLLIAAILHDTGERFAGDLPAPVKRANPELASRHAALERFMREQTIHLGGYDLSEFDTSWLKMCDMLECVLFASLTVPDALNSKPWVSLVDAICEFSKALDPKPLANISDLISEAKSRSGFSEAGGDFDYSKYATMNAA